MARLLSSEQWTRYWQKGTATAFIGRFDNNYDGELRDFWREQFGRLHENARLIDLATGNGALAILAAEYARDNNASWRITGVDFAQIDPANLIADGQPPEIMDKIDFLSGTSIEATNLPAGAFDFAMSQFGFEYADLTRAVREVARILNQKGRFVAMMHFEESALFQQANDGIRQVNACRQSHLHEHLRRLVKRVDAIRERGLPPANDNRAENLRFTINRITEELHAAMGNHEDPRQIGYFLENSMAVFHARFKRETTRAKLEFLHRIAEETEAYERRMGDLIAAAKTKGELSQLQRQLEAGGFSVVASDVFQVENTDFCHRLVAER